MGRSSRDTRTACWNNTTRCTDKGGGENSGRTSRARPVPSCTEEARVATAARLNQLDRRNYPAVALRVLPDLLLTRHYARFLGELCAVSPRVSGDEFSTRSFTTCGSSVAHASPQLRSAELQVWNDIGRCGMK